MGMLPSNQNSSCMWRCSFIEPKLADHVSWFSLRSAKVYNNRIKFHMHLYTFAAQAHPKMP